MKIHEYRQMMKYLTREAKNPTPRVDFKLAQAGFESSIPTKEELKKTNKKDEPADVYQISKRLNQFRRPDDQLPVMNEQGDFVRGDERKPLGEFEGIVDRLKKRDQKPKKVKRKPVANNFNVDISGIKDAAAADQRIKNIKDQLDFLKVVKEVRQMNAESKIAEERFKQAMKSTIPTDSGGIPYLLGVDGEKN